ncbi:hypothetical protein ACFFX0_32160 [Citricoccus parietis]|uniref:Uncharacterized protein n=1 Tax=Citricoccus parietis TaxID=592307 RepID=A0ABV5G9H5_9MICC
MLVSWTHRNRRVPVKPRAGSSASWRWFGASVWLISESSRQ